MELGENILKCGGEVSRAEDSINRICRAYGAVNVDVSAILSVIVLTVDFGEGSVTSSRRIEEFGTSNLGRLSKLNALSRRVCSDTPTKEEFLKQMAYAIGSTQISMRRLIIGSILTSMGFAMFFSDFSVFSNGINAQMVLSIIFDGVLSGIIALPLCLIAKFLSGTKINAIFAKFAVCFLGGIAALLLGMAGVPCRVDIIMIGNIMNFVSGVSMTNAFRDLFGGDIMSGVFRLCATLVDTVSIAAGYAVAILLFSSLGGAT
jgi:uncharacterized membrane protein YjjP (DUF1212 family)